MAVITATSTQGLGTKPISITTLGASDTLVYRGGKQSTLVLNNVTAGALTPLIVGADASTDYVVPGVGTIDLSVGEQLASIGIGAEVLIRLDNISAKLKGVITITGGDGIEASLLEY